MLDRVLPILPPFEFTFACNVQMETEVWVFVLRDLSRSNDMPLENDIFPRLFRARVLVARSGDQRYPIGATEYGDASRRTLGIGFSHGHPACVFRKICISARPP